MDIGEYSPFTSVAFAGTGLDNVGQIGFGNATITGNVTNEASGQLINFSNATAATIAGNLTNAGYFQPYVDTITGTVTNSGTISLGTFTNAIVNGGGGTVAAQLKATGGLTNTGLLQFNGGRLTGGAVANNPGGEMQFQSGLTGNYAFSQAVANSGGTVIVQGSTQVTFSNFTGNTAGGDIQIQSGGTFTATTASPNYPNSGTIELQGPTSALNGSTLSNSGSITGLGRISNTVQNTGVIEATVASGGTSGPLMLSGASSTNAGGQLIIDSGATLLYSQGLRPARIDHQ